MVLLTNRDLASPNSAIPDELIKEVRSQMVAENGKGADQAYDDGEYLRPRRVFEYQILT